MVGQSVQRIEVKKREKIGIVSTKVNALFSVSFCLKLLTNQMDREDKALLSREPFFERMSQVVSTGDGNRSRGDQDLPHDHTTRARNAFACITGIWPVF